MKNLKSLLLVIVVASIGVGLYYYWQYAAAHPSTDDSYVQANILTIAPQIGGTVATVEVRENTYVAQGDTLFTIDTEALEVARDAAMAQLDQARNVAVANEANRVAAEADLSTATATRDEAQTEFDRQQSLGQDGTVPTATVDQYRAALQEAQGAVDAAEAALNAAAALVAPDGGAPAAVRAAQANLDVAELNLTHATITAPAEGWISNIDLRPGQLVLAGAPQFSLVENDGWWVEANFKETDLATIRPDMPATISLDMYPGMELTGIVASIGAGSGASFSLLPAQNATGNWVKVTQRFAVQIVLDALPEDPATPLRMGASATVTVDTTGDTGGETGGETVDDTTGDTTGDLVVDPVTDATADAPQSGN